MSPLSSSGRTLTGFHASTSFAPKLTPTSRSLRIRVAAKKEDDPFTVLGISRAMSRAEVRKMYLMKVKLLHPDVYRGPDDSTALTAALNLAYEKILAMYESGALKGTC